MARLQSRQISQLHQYQLLHAVRLADAPLSRAEIAEATGLSQPAVSALTRRLLDSGALREAGARPSSGIGRRERELQVDPDFAWVVGVKLSMDHCTVTITDFAGAVRSSDEVAWSTPTTQAMLVREVAAAVRRCLSSGVALPLSRLAGIGVAVPGFVDSRQGTVLWSPVLKGEESMLPWPLAERLSSRVGVPVFVENDANMLALADQWYGRSGRAANVAMVTLEHGLGLGLVINGELYRGHSGLAAELGHLQIEIDGRACRCGKRGCLDTVSSMKAIKEMSRAEGLECTSLSDIEYEASTGNAAAIRILHRAGSGLGLAIANLIQINDPGLILITHVEGSFDGLFGTVVNQAIETNVLPRYAGQTPIRIKRVDGDVWARGAASIAAHNFLIGPNSN